MDLNYRIRQLSIITFSLTLLLSLTASNTVEGFWAHIRRYQHDHRQKCCSVRTVTWAQVGHNRPNQLRCFVKPTFLIVSNPLERAQIQQIRYCTLRKTSESPAARQNLSRGGCHLGQQPRRSVYSYDGAARVLYRSVDGRGGACDSVCTAGVSLG